MGTDGDDSFDAPLGTISVEGTTVPAPTLTGADMLNGGEGNDVLNASLTSAGIFETVNPTVENIEVFNLTANATLMPFLPVIGEGENSQELMDPSVLDLRDVSGVEQLWMVNTESEGSFEPGDSGFVELGLFNVQEAAIIGVRDSSNAIYDVWYAADALGSAEATQAFVFDNAGSATNGPVGVDVYTGGDDAITTANMSVTGDNFVAFYTGAAGNDTIETLNIAAANGEDSIAFAADTELTVMTDLTLTGDLTVDFSDVNDGSSGGTDSLTTVTVTDDAGATLDLGATFALAADGFTYTGGAGDDVLAADVSSGDFTNADGTIDGGEGQDTLNLTGDDSTSGDVSNVAVTDFEIVNITDGDSQAGSGSSALTDASLYEGVEQLWQIDGAADVTNLGAGTAAGFRAIDGVDVNVTATETATSATLALDELAGGSGGEVTALGESIGVLEVVGRIDVAGAALDTVNVAGNLTPTTEDALGLISVGVSAGSETETLTVNSDVAVEIFLNDADRADDATAVTTLNAAGAVAGAMIGADLSEGSLTPTDDDENKTLSSVITGDAGDLVFMTTAQAEDAEDDVNVTVNTAGGDDLIGLDTDVEGSVSVNAGDGDDLISLAAASDNAQLALGNSFDGGEGDDTFVINPQETYSEQDLVVLRNTVSNVETLKIEGSVQSGTLDVSQLNGEFDTIAFEGMTQATVTGVGDETIVSENGAGLDVTADGYSGDSFGGDLNIEIIADDFTEITDPAPYVMPVEVVAKGSEATLDVVAQNTSEDRSAFENSAALLAVDRLKGDAETVTVNLTSGVNTPDGESPTASNNFAAASINATEDEVGFMTNLTSIDVNGNGISFVETEEGSKLATTNASGLNSALLADYAPSSVDFKILFGEEEGPALESIYGGTPLKAGDQGFGLVYASTNKSLAETVTLSAGVDIVQLTEASTFENMDTINGLSLEIENGSLTNQSDLLRVEQGDDTSYDQLTAEEIADINAIANNLEEYLVGINQETDKSDVVFDFGGDTYVYNSGGDGFNEADGLVKLAGGVDIDAALESLNAVVPA